MLIRLVSINIWDLPISFPGFDRPERRERLLRDLPALDPDIVVIQEAFNPAHKANIRAALPAHHPDAYVNRRRLALPLVPTDCSGGLLTLSRWPIAASRMQRWRHMRLIKWDERLGRKGTLWTELQTPAGPLFVANVHFHAGRFAPDARARVAQVREFLAQPEVARTGPMIVAGDLNIDPHDEPRAVSPNGFDLLSAAGFTEVAGGVNTGLGTIVTERNRYTRFNPLRPPHRRLTHVWFRGPALTRGPEPPSICLDNPPVSDHFGFRATLELDG